MDTNSMNIQEIAKAERTEALIAQLIRIWKDSVRASHHFLTEDDICHLTPQAEGALRFIDTLLVAYETENPVGFMGIQAQKIEMLFLSPACFGQGLGKRLVRLAFDKWDVRYVDVNEQNEGARGFYERMGFKVFKRNKLDSEGNPFPILEMGR